MFKWIKRSLRRSPKQEDVYLPDTWKWNDLRSLSAQQTIQTPFLKPRYNLPIQEPYYAHDEYDGLADALKELTNGK